MLIVAREDMRGNMVALREEAIAAYRTIGPFRSLDKDFCFEVDADWFMALRSRGWMCDMTWIAYIE